MDPGAQRGFEVLPADLPPPTSLAIPEQIPDSGASSENQLQSTGRLLLGLVFVSLHCDWSRRECGAGPPGKTDEKRRKELEGEEGGWSEEGRKEATAASLLLLQHHEKPP